MRAGSSSARDSAAAAPWSRSEEAALVEQAIRYIRDLVRAEDLEFTLEVGRHLFEGLFKSNVALYRRGGRWKDRALSRIAADERTRMSDQELAKCVRCHLAVREFGRAAPDLPLPALTPWEWGTLFFPLRHDPSALAAIAIYADREKLDISSLRSLAQSVRPYLASGGKLGDLLAGVDTTGSMVLRILGVIRRMVERRGVPRIARARTALALRGILARLGRSSG